MLNETPAGELDGFVENRPPDLVAPSNDTAAGELEGFVENRSPVVPSDGMVSDCIPDQPHLDIHDGDPVTESPTKTRTGATIAARIGLAGMTLVAGIYLGHRILVFFEACTEIHVALGVGYLIGLGMALVCLAYFGLRARRRYGRLRSVERFRVLSSRVRQKVTDDKEERQVRALIDEFVANTQRNPKADLRNRAGRLHNQLSNHSDASRAIQELEDFLLTELDGTADRLIERCAAQVAVGTALASGIFDAIIVAAQAVNLVDGVSQIYAGRPGVLGTIRLLRRALAITIFAEVAEQATELLTDAVATKAAAKLGGRLGQGLANGLLIGRLGHAVKRQCRPVEAIPPTSLRVTTLVNSVLNLARHSR